MEHFQRLEEDVANLILRHGFLDPDDLPFVTPGEVENAAALALQMADPDEQLAIAMRRSTIRDRRSPAPRRPDNRDPGPAAYINWQERNRLLADSAATSPAASANNSENGEGEERECVICSGGRKPKLRLPCGCWMCARCLRACIRAGLRPGGWPPRCCEPLHLESVERAGRPGLLRLYRQIREENETPGNARVYCARPECAAFIPPAGLHVRGDEMRCPACGEGTCRLCRNPVHPGRPCRVEDEDEMLMDIMDLNGLSSCPQCRRVVELRDGCNHIT